MGYEPARDQDVTASRALERVSDADRERAAQFVQAALGEGQIGLDEIDERLGAVMAARTRGDLESALIHLPGAEAVLAATETVAASHSAEPATINGTHTKIERTGRWTVPSQMSVTLVHSSLMLDLMEAELPGSTIRIEADLTHSQLRLIVPGDIRVESADLEQQGSRVRVEPSGGAWPPRAVVVLTGRLHWSRVVAAPPGWRRRRSLRRVWPPAS